MSIKVLGLDTFTTYQICLFHYSYFRIKGSCLALLECNLTYYMREFTFLKMSSFVVFNPPPNFSSKDINILV